MIYLLALVTGLSDSAYAALNALSGRSWYFDMLVALPMDNALVKAGPIGACFCYAWFADADPAEAKRRRRVLIVTLLAVFFVVATTKTLSREIFLPRPFVLSQAVFVIDDAQLVPAERLEYRVPLGGQNRDRYEELQRGDILQNDLGSFPSDHAGLYVALALGVVFACRLAGFIALAWAVFVVLLSRIVTGMHSPLDIVAGAAIGAGWLFACQAVFNRWLSRLADPVAGLSLRYHGLSAALLFLALFEATNTLTNVEDLLWWTKEVADRVRGA
jgi:membrane-associated phospholipid phosphatase